MFEARDGDGVVESREAITSIEWTIKGS